MWDSFSQEVGLVRPAQIWKALFPASVTLARETM